jgi:sodium/proline symporter
LYIGSYFYKKTVKIEDYLLGGRGMGVWVTALLGMVVGTVVLVVWKQVGLGEKMYEIVPGFVANCLTIFIFNIFTGQKDEKILKEYNEVLEVIDKDAVSSD